MPAKVKLFGLVDTIYNPQTAGERVYKGGMTRHLIEDLAGSCGFTVTARQPKLYPSLGLIEKTRLGANLRAATENPTLVRAFGINVPRMITLTYGLGVGLAALAGVLSAPINQVRPLMGADLIIVVFAVVVIGGMGSIMGSIITGFALGVIEGLTKYFYPEASNPVVFVLMVLVLLVKPAGLTGRAA